MRDTVNKEGLTFEEWVCAAGYAKFDGGCLRPYVTSSSHAVSNSPDAINWASPEKVKQLEVSACRRYWCGGYKYYVIKRSVAHYSKKIRDAWKAGEDPTDHMAELTRRPRAATSR